ncbi:MAG: class I SAM-dependent methyltransferase [bacterium]|nr:class I SAM-dependent methyltransferase [bacterium]
MKYELGMLARNRRDWDNMTIRGMHPDTNLITCCKRLFPNGKDKKLLYIGFGEGQNLAYLASEGFRCYGTEISRNRLQFVKREFAKRNTKADLRLVTSSELSFQKNFFDIVVAWQSIYYNDRNGLEATLREVLRVLKPGGQFLSAMLSAKHKNLCGREIAPSVFIPRAKSQSHCTTFGFKSSRQIRSMYRHFENIKIGYYSSRIFDNLSHHYVIYCTKPI